MKDKIIPFIMGHHDFKPNYPNIERGRMALNDKDFSHGKEFLIDDGKGNISRKKCRGVLYREEKSYQQGIFGNPFANIRYYRIVLFDDGSTWDESKSDPKSNPKPQPADDFLPKKAAAPNP